MLYTDFYFRMKRQDAVCIAGWTQGPIENAVLHVGDQRLPATSALTHMRADLPTGAIGFILRFELGGEILDVETTKLHLSGPDRIAAFPPSSANIDALIGAATDDGFLCLMMGVVDGVFAIEEPASFAKAHKRLVSIAANRPFAELPGAAVAQDQALSFANPPRLLVNGWMGDDENSEIKHQASIIDSAGIAPVALFPNALMRPDLAGVQIRSLNVGVSSGFVGTARLEPSTGTDPVCLVGLIQDGTTLATLRSVQPKGLADLGGQFELMRRNLVAADKADTIFGNLLPSLPDHLNGVGEPVDRSQPPQGLAYVLELDLDHWQGRDVVRLVRCSDSDVVRVSLITDQASEGLIRSTLFDRIEAGASAPRLDLVTANQPLARWAPEARHLICSTAVTLFHTMPFAMLAKARAEEVGALCIVLIDDLESGPAEIAPEVAAEALMQGKPFVAQLDQSMMEPLVHPECLHMTQTGQMRWLMVSLAKTGAVTFIGLPGLSFLPGRDPVPAQSRQIELRAMRLVAEETAN
ncbi:hypothetical protein [Stagnihabitans tardus]|uniref:Uncharacterized protein n=1 Tax=Stagnihabitans tardus TaxID=2699202 RepID=A0AAE4Y8V8_9RHOB|nr:hypothetical protein [Stagnihabitans tardus]NBZ86828.1 hypothetical protein [Stagnihabitans tardus]